MIGDSYRRWGFSRFLGELSVSEGGMILRRTRIFRDDVTGGGEGRCEGVAESGEIIRPWSEFPEINENLRGP